MTVAVKAEIILHGQAVESKIDQLTKTILLQHNRCKLSASELVERMIECGESMLKLKNLVPHGKWHEYVRSHLDMHPKTAGTYIRFASYSQTLREHQPTSVHHARKVLSEIGMPAVNDASEQRKIAKKLRKQGMTYPEIAEKMGVPHSTVSYWLNTERYKRHRDKAHAQMRGAKAALLREQAKKSLKEAKGTELERAYSLLRKSIEALQRFQSAGGDSQETHQHVGRAMASLYRAEDLIVSASKAKYVK